MEPKTAWEGVENIETGVYTSYRCPICGVKMVRDTALFLTHTKFHILEALRKYHQNLGSRDGGCERCENFVQKLFHR